MPRSNRRLALLMGLALLPMAGCASKEQTVGVSITGIDHLAEHLSIQNFWVNGAAGQQAGGGGSTVCCAKIPPPSQRQATVKVRWAVTNWKRRVYGYVERDVQLERCEGPLMQGHLTVHFLADGGVRAIDCAFGPGGWNPNPDYPGPQPLATTIVRDKKPWTDYKRKPGEPEFAEVNDPMRDE